MIVKDIFDQYKGVNVKLGAKKGSSYVFCGPIDDNFISYIQSMDEFYKNTYKNSVEKLKYDSDEDIRADFLHKIELWNLRHKKIKMTYTDADCKKFIRNRKRAYANAVMKKNNFTSILEKEITDEPVQLTFEDSVKFLYDGYEIGLFWTIDECEYFKRTGKRPKELYREREEKLKNEIQNQ